MAKTKKVRPSQRARADTEAARPRKAERQTLPRKAKHYKDLLQTQASTPQTRKLAEGATMENETYLAGGLPYGGEEAEDLIASKLRTLSERGLPADRERVVLDALNAGEIATFEERPAVQPRARRGASAPVVDDF